MPCQPKPGGGHAVEVVGVDGIHHLVVVTLGLFDHADGLVEVAAGVWRCAVDRGRSHELDEHQLATGRF